MNLPAQLPPSVASLRRRPRKASEGSSSTGSRGESPTEHHALLALRLSLVLTFLLFGLQKFTDAEARGITEYTLHSPLLAWVTPIGYRDVGRLFGVAELTWGFLLAAGFRRPGSAPALLGALGSAATFLVTLSFLLTTPGLFVPGQAPVLDVEGLFLCKGVVLLAASLVLLAQELARRDERDA